MTYKKMHEIIKDTIIAHADDYEYIAVRFENKERKAGDICENSKDNPDREDERDFPEYGSGEYDSLPELDGTCAWYVYYYYNDFAESMDINEVDALKIPYGNTADDEYTGNCEHAYIIASNYGSSNMDGDHGEVLLTEPVVLEVIY